ncbi:cell division protein FtsA [Pseudopedobacter saltans DSM 12145]|uniref:Cell division protein FtsA n=1 Tax=Pseudopedobacter saltans (strain ATCC 51119 / DSM 12145 / JCM 21818 / CCUG 39354 / LMG 10337 / NBRC 100064 / NCIMB 13643) TaxID=762903 RepID=F0SDJ6_PSESL|nr:cell division protein FtsA [Pseudopedobacter saltans]ADY50723.1 cell division protein FtsA [Pseudopedobacter saltans DSM 12145]
MEKGITKQSKASPIVVGLDIGTTKICVIVGRRTEHGKIEVLGVGRAESAGVTRGVVSNIAKTVRAIVQSVEEGSTQSNVDIKIVNVGIAGQHIKSLQHRGILTRKDLSTEISKRDIDRLIDDMFKLAMNPGEEIIHVLPQEFTVDNEPGIKDPVGMAGVRLEANFHIITGQVTAVRNIMKCVDQADLEIQDLILEPLASSESVLSEEEKEAGVVLVDIGGGTTDVAIFHEGIIRHTAVIPFGGNSITEDIREGCSVMRNQAELLKLKFGSALAEENKENEIICVPGLRGREPKEISVKNLAYVIQARMEEIIDHVYYEIKSSGYEKKLIGGIVITGGGAQLKHLSQLVEYVTGLDCRVGYPNEHLAKNETLPKNIYEDLKSPMFATGIGLLIKGIDKIESEIQHNDYERKVTPAPQEAAKKNRGLFASLLEGTKKFIKDDISDQDFLR